ncbi:hypothetical protein BaRGS_00025981, partial [Batillaria attramentaria]
DVEIDTNDHKQQLLVECTFDRNFSSFKLSRTTQTVLAVLSKRSEDKLRHERTIRSYDMNGRSQLRLLHAFQDDTSAAAVLSQWCQDADMDTKGQSGLRLTKYNHLPRVITDYTPNVSGGATIIWIMDRSERFQDDEGSTPSRINVSGRTWLVWGWVVVQQTADCPLDTAA